MHSARPRPAARHIPRRAVAVLVAAVLGALTGCGSMDGAQQMIDRAHLVNKLASRLDHASELTYTADYQLSGGANATIAQAQDPVRAAYLHPGAKLVTTPDATIDCRTDNTMTCTLTPPPSPSPDATTTLLNALRDRGLATPTLVVGLLTAASLSSDTVITQHDTTLAGEHATCVDVSGVENSAASQFDACITSAGVLGSFKGAVDGRELEVSLIRYVTSVAGDAFDLPAGARTVDERPAR
jgi:hypothetical protein